MAWKPAYVSTADLRAFRRITDTLDDAILGLAIEGASRAIDRHTRRQFGVVDAAEERRYTPYRDRRPMRHRPRWVVPIDDLMTQDDLAVSVAATSAPITTFHLRPPNEVKKGRPWTELVVDARADVVLFGDEDEIAVTARWGWTSVPDAVREAALLQASRLASRRSSPYGVAGSPETGSELRLLERLDPDVAITLTDFVRDWAVA